MTLNRNFLNVITLSWGFMLVFTAFQTMGNIEKTVLDSIEKETPNFTGDGYASLSIIYAVLAICNWLAPSYISMTGPRAAIVTGAFCYVFFIAIFFWPQYILLYCASAVLGLGAALIWTGHGQYLTENSDSETMSRNAGIFWAIFQTSMFTGNLLVYFLFIGSEINASTRKIVFSVLTALAIVGTCLLATLRKSSRGLILGEIEGANRELQIPEPRREEPLLAAWNALTDAFKLFITPSIGFTEAIGDLRVSLVGLSGIFVGIGEVIGGALFGIFASKVSRVCGVWTVVLTGFCVHLFAFLTIFLNLPNDCPFGATTDVGFINPSPILAMAGSLALGFGDACYNTQVYSLLGTLYAQNNASAFALFKFCQSLAAAVSFAYSNVIGLYIQLLILVISIIIGTITFCFVERIARIENDNTPSEANSTFVTQ